MTLKKAYANLETKVDRARAVVAKAAAGNKAAAVRLRKAMQEVKDAANNVRVWSWDAGPSADDVAKEVGRQVGRPGADTDEE